MIDFSIQGWSNSSDRKVDVILDPASRSVWCFQPIGNETPMPVWHRLQRVILTVPAATCATALLAWLEAREAEIEAIASHYEGEEWDGHNHVGSWSEDVQAALYALSDAYAEEPIATYWSASEYFAPVWRDTGFIDQILGYANLEAAVDDEVHSAAQSDALLDEDDTRDALLAILRDALERILDRHASLSTTEARREAATRARRIRAALNREEAA